MKVKIIEGTNGFNWGKFLVAKFDAEWQYRSALDGLPMLRSRGWGPEHIFVMDLQTGEGFCTSPHGLATADLDKHNIWVCPMFQPFLEWLYRQDLKDLDKLPPLVELVGESSLAGYRREGLPWTVLSTRTRRLLGKHGVTNFRALTALTWDQFCECVGNSEQAKKEVAELFAKEGFSFAWSKPR